MTVSGPKIRDFTDQQRSLRLLVESEAVYETLLAMFVCHGEVEQVDYESADDIVGAIRNASASLADDLATYSGCGELGLTLIGIAHDMGSPRSVERLVAHLRESDPTFLRTMLMRSSGIKPSRGHDEATIERAAKGDVDAVHELYSSLPRETNLAALLARAPEAMVEQVASLVERFDAAVGPLIAERQGVLDRDAANTRAMAKTMRPERLVERVTNGITFEWQPAVTGVLLIPSAVIRPWVVLSEHKTLRIFCYSVSDERLASDPDSPPDFLVEIYKALGDEKRLRMLAVLADGDLGLKEIAERVDLAKSTVHHHLRMLRGAGLVRLIVSDDDKRYSLRRDAVPEAGRLLETFLSPRPAPQTPSQPEEETS